MPEPKDVSVEYAHIYANQLISEEHELSIHHIKQITHELKAKGLSGSLVVMVDDYSFPDPSFSYAKFSRWLKIKDYPPDLLIRESQLIPQCDEVLAMIEDRKLKKQLSDEIRAKKYPCSLFVAAWYLLRLGKLHSPLFSRNLQAARLINILPESFKPFEDQGLEIIAATPCQDVLPAIEHRYLPGRSLA
ncbi:MAG TPA: hypothetical protein VLF43_01085 [Candidatus Saccharimonadales bacterium]|nr:hypothetical protein [Candidatus Saccharimonadales bacterium]